MGKNPTWNDSLVFKLRGGEQQIHCQLWDKDVGSKDDFIAETQIPLAEVLSKRQTSDWINVHRKGKAAGQIHIQMQFVPTGGQMGMQ